MGLQVLSDLKPSSELNRWDGRVYNIDDGKTYSARVTLLGADQLKVEGCVLMVCSSETWTRQDHPTGQFYHVTTTSDVPYHICGAQQDNSTACVSSQPLTGFAAITGGADVVFYSVGGGESGYIANDPRNADIFYAGSYGGVITRFNRKTGQTRAINPYPDNPMGYATKDIVVGAVTDI